MTNEEQRYAIAAACPSVFVRPLGSDSWNYNNSIAGRLLPCIDGDPLKDMNACHEMENTLPSNLKVIYYQNLRDEVSRFHACWDSFDEGHRSWLIIHATAQHRVPAFIKTIGSWKD